MDKVNIGNILKGVSNLVEVSLLNLLVQVSLGHFYLPYINILTKLLIWCKNILRYLTN